LSDRFLSAYQNSLLFLALYLITSIAFLAHGKLIWMFCQALGGEKVWLPEV